MSGKHGTLIERFWMKVRPEVDGCWLWHVSKGKAGYGQIPSGGLGGTNYRAHRVSWEIHYGPIPDGLCVLHKCDVRDCVRPDHLFLGTRADNAADRGRKGRTRTGCLRGEEHARAQLTEHQVGWILASPRCSTRELADEYGVSMQTIRRVRNFERYASWRTS